MNQLEHGKHRACDVQTDLCVLLEEVEAGEKVIIARHGTPMAGMVPAKRRLAENERRAAIAR